MLVHTVIFWLKDELSEDEVAAFRSGLESLKRIEAARAVYVGSPAGTARPIVDNSYHFGLTTVFEDMAAHDAYQSHATHQAFLEKFAPCWKKVVVYDVD